MTFSLCTLLFAPLGINVSISSLVHTVIMAIVAVIFATPIDEQCKSDFCPNKVKLVQASVTVASLHY